MGSSVGRGTYLGCGFDLWLGHKQEAPDQCFFLSSMSPSRSLSHSHAVSLPSSLSQINESIALSED